MLRRLCLLALLLALPLRAAELTIDLGHGVKTYSAELLLARSDVRDITIPDDVPSNMPCTIAPCR